MEVCLYGKPRGDVVQTQFWTFMCVHMQEERESVLCDLYLGKANTGEREQGVL